MPNMHDNSRLVRIPLDFYEQLRSEAERERRTIQQQLLLHVENGRKYEAQLRARRNRASR